ncbi:MAG: tetratricopeptide repeat protein [Rhodospirillales bacterium]|nr:tetratricopeptide repeat protein [Rhodospirillales bacterium]
MPLQRFLTLLSKQTLTARRLGALVAVVSAVTACSAGGGPLASDSVGSDAPRTAPAAEVGTSAYGHYLAGRHAQAIHDTGSGADYYLEALRREPDNMQLVRRAFSMMVMEGRIAGTRAFAEKILAVEKDDPMAALVLISQDVLDGRAHSAAERVVKLSNTGINAFIVPMLTAWTMVAEGEFDKALGALGKISKEEGFSSLFSLHAALVNEAAGRYDAAVEHYRNAVSDNGLSLRVVELLGALHERNGRLDDALAAYELYRREHPESPLIMPLIEGVKTGRAGKTHKVTAADGIAEAFFGISSSLRQQNARDMATMFNRLALYLKPDFPIARILMADILESEGRLEEANATYALIGENSTFWWAARLRTAINLDARNRPEEAVAMLEKMAAKRPGEYEPLLQIGDIMRSRSRFGEAVSAYDRAVSRLGKVEPQHWTIFYSRGIALERSKQWQRAEDDFLMALSLNEDQPYVLNYLGYSWVEQGIRLEEARAMIEKAVSLRPNDGYIVDSLGWILYRLDDIEGAVKYLEKAVELRPDDPTINDHLGDAYWRVGRRLEAGFQWRRALNLNPDEALRRAIEAKVGKGLGGTDEKNH